MTVATQTPDAAALLRELGLLEEQEVCAILGVTVATGRNRQATGKFPPHYSVGKRKLFKRVEVEAWIKRQRVARAAG
jgi:predicted DNA-binding transcriptional regulator AlpA